MAQRPAQLRGYVGIQVQLARFHQPHHADGDHQFGNGSNAHRVIGIDLAATSDICESVRLRRIDAIAVEADTHAGHRFAGLQRAGQRHQQGWQQNPQESWHVYQSKK